MPDDDLDAARGIAIAIPVALLMWALIIGVFWALAPMMEEERTIDVIVAEWAGQ